MYLEIKQRRTEQPVGQREYQRKKSRFWETNENDDASYQNTQGTARAVLRENFIAMKALIRKQKRI